MTVLALTACGGGGTDNSSVSYTVSGTVSGLNTNGLILSSNGTSSSAQTVPVSSNASAFSFPSTMTGSHNVTVLRQPTGQSCTVSNGSANDTGSNVTTVAVQCRAYSVYVANRNIGTISQYTVGSDGALTPKSTPSISVALSSLSSSWLVTAIAISKDGQHAWASYGNDPSIANLLVDSSGMLSLQGTVSQAASLGYSLALNPLYGTLYSANYSVNSVSSFSIGSSGLASSIGAVNSGGQPFGLAVTPDGAHVYVANSQVSSAGGTSISSYNAASSGSLSLITTTSTSSIGRPTGLTIGASGGTYYLYATFFDNAKLVSYTINSTTGALQVRSTVSTGTTPNGVAVTPDGAYVYVANAGSNTISQYSVTSGALTPLLTATVATGSTPSAITVSPDGNYLYVANQDSTVWQYSIGSDGALTPLSPASLNTGTNAASVAITVF